MSVVNNEWRSLHYGAAADTQAGRLVVKGFTWSGSTNATHTMAMKDTAGALIFGPITAGVIGQEITVSFGTPILLNGLEVDVLGSGVVDVFLA